MRFCKTNSAEFRDFSLSESSCKCFVSEAGTFSPRPGPHSEVALQAFAIEPWFAAMDVANVDEVAIGMIFRSAIALHHQDMLRGRKRHGDAVVEHGGGSICSPIHGVDAHAGGGNDRIHVFHVLHGVVANGDARVVLCLRRANTRADGGVFWGHLIA